MLKELIMACAESGSTSTLCFHAVTHVFGQPHLPIQYNDGVGERDLRLGKIFAS